MSSADIAACFPSEHDSLLGVDVESRRRSSKPFYLTRSSLETRKKDQGGLAGWWARFGEGGTIFDAFLMEASQQVGQSLLTLPWAFSLMGYGWAITSLLGLSLISSSFLIPALAWNLYYNSDERVKQMPKPIALGLQVPTVKVMNWVFILIILVLGLGMGGWASIKTMDEKVKEFELFDRCNGC